MHFIEASIALCDFQYLCREEAILEEVIEVQWLFRWSFFKISIKTIASWKLSGKTILSKSIDLRSNWVISIGCLASICVSQVNVSITSCPVKDRICRSRYLIYFNFLVYSCASNEMRKIVIGVEAGVSFSNILNFFSQIAIRVCVAFVKGELSFRSIPIGVKGITCTCNCRRISICKCREFIHSCIIFTSSLAFMWCRLFCTTTHPVIEG